MSHTTEDFVSLWQSAMNQGQFRSLTIADRFRKGGELPHKQMVRPILIKEEIVYQWELPGEKKQTHLNLSPEESIARFQEQFGSVYREAYLFTSEEDIAARVSKKGVHLKRRPATNDAVPAPEPHNRVKKYLIPENTPCAFLQALGVMNAAGVVKKQKQKKFRQINRYLEIVNDIYLQLPKDGPIRVIDFGCGLSYLTFGLHHLLTVIHQREVEMVGIDRNEDVIARCTKISKKLDLKGLRFNAGNIDAESGHRHVHLAISLHACDTATDHALAYSVASNADVILAVPCCQHELNTKLNCESLQALTRFGILKERFAAQATDALRAAALEASGYQTQILEFIDLEHTPKNLLIRSVKHTGQKRDVEAYETFKSYLGVNELATDMILRAVAANPVVEETVADVTVDEAPIVEETIQEKVSQQPAVEEPAVEEPAVEEPVVEEPVVEEPVVEEPVVEEPVVEEPVQQPVIEQPVVESPWGKRNRG